MRLIFSIICCLILLFGYGQDKKNERESRLKKKNVPTEILESLEEILAESNKVRFFAETDGDKKSVEAKLVFEGKRYSIEFDQQSHLEDIEVLVPFKEIPDAARNRIKDYFDSYDKFRLDKVQKQYSDPEEKNEEVIRTALREDDAKVIRYEIEVNVKSNGKWESFEMLFSEAGQFISKREIVHRSTEYIIYQ